VALVRDALSASRSITEAEMLVRVPEPVGSGWAPGGDETVYDTGDPSTVAAKVAACSVMPPGAVPEAEVIPSGGVPRHRLSDVHEASDIVKTITVTDPAGVLMVCSPW
jgi:hypothetical protein